MKDISLNDKLIEQVFNLQNLMRKEIRGASKILSLTVIQLSVLRLLDERKTVLMHEIAEHFHITRPTATFYLEKLTKMNLVIKKTDKQDKRKTIISLSQSGKRLIGQAVKKQNQRMNILLSYLTITEKRKMTQIMGKILKKLN